MTHAWFDISAGVSGDMLLGALIDAGADLALIQETINAVIPDTVKLTSRQVDRGGQRALKVDVHRIADDQPHRTFTTITQMISQANIDDDTRQLALAVFATLAAAEARVHGIAVENVHFHEVGSWDSIADIVGASAALTQLGVDSISASPAALGSGRIAAAHGDIPVPAPAVAQLALGWQVNSGPIALTTTAQHEHHHEHHGGHDVEDHHHHKDHHAHAHSHSHTHHGSDSHHHDHHDHDQPAKLTTPGQTGELATPTGLAFIRAAASCCEALPSLIPTAIGIGAGAKDFSGFPNVVRVVIGQPTSNTASTDATEQTPISVIDIQANVDDMSPQLLPGIIDALLEAGAVDAWLSPIIMKKGRPAHNIHALTPPQFEAQVSYVLLHHSSTLGVRKTSMTRSILERDMYTIDLGGHLIEVKVAHINKQIVHAAPEFEQLRQAAHALGITEREALEQATAKIFNAGLTTANVLSFEDGRLIQEQRR